MRLVNERFKIPALWKRLGTNTLWLALSQLGSQAMMVLFTVLVARRLGEVGLGMYAFMAAVVMLGNVVTTYGTDMLIIREVAAHDTLPLLPAALAVQLTLAALFVVLVFLGAPALSNQTPEAVRALQLYSLALFPLAFYTVFSAALRGYQHMEAFTWLNLIVAALQVGLAWFFIQPGSSLETLAWLLLGVQLAAALLAAWFCLAHIPGLRRAWRVSRAAVFSLVGASAPIALLGFLKVLYQKLSIYMLANMQGAAVTGWFSAASQAVTASHLVHVAFLGAIFPVMAQAQIGGQGDPNQWQRTFWRAQYFLLALGGAIAVLLFLLAPLLVNLLFGAGFEPAVPALRLLAWTLIPYSLNLFLSSRLLSARQERPVAYALAISLLVLLGLSAWWIPRWGLPGACLALLVAEWVQAGLYLWRFK